MTIGMYFSSTPTAWELPEIISFENREAMDLLPTHASATRTSKYPE